MQGVERAVATATPADLERINALIEQLQKAIGDGAAVVGADSILSVGPRDDGSYLLRLVNDNDAPGARYVYSADENGVKGWHSLTDAIGVGPSLDKAVDWGDWNYLGELPSVDDLPGDSEVGDAYVIEGKAYIWDGIGWLREDIPGDLVLSLVNDEEAPGNTQYYGTDASGGKGWHPASDVVAVEDGELTKVVGPDGVSTLGLADLPNTGGGTLQRLDRDAKGRVSGTSDATTDDLPEGSDNLYFTDERASAAAPVQSVNGQTGAVSLNASDVGAIPDAPTDGTIYGRQDGAWVGVAAGAGTVTSVGLSAPTGLSVTGSPVTSAGTLELAWSSGYQGYTADEATKLAGIATGAQVNVATNLAQGTRTETTVLVASSTGTGATLAAATTSLAGVMSSADKTKLDGIASGATVGAAWATNLSGIPANITGWAGIATAEKFNTSGGTVTGSTNIQGILAVQSAGGTISYGGFAGAGSASLVFFAENMSMFFRPAGRTIATGIGITTTVFRPEVTNAMDVGAANFRFKDGYFVNAIMILSDAREKTEPRDMDSAEIAAALDIGRLPCIFQWRHAIEEKDSDARLHAGPTVQAVIATMEAHGLDPFRYGFVCYDAWPEQQEFVHSWGEERDEDGSITREAGSEVVQEYQPAGDRYSLRPSELEAFCRRALAADRDALEARLSALESGLSDAE